MRSDLEEKEVKMTTDDKLPHYSFEPRHNHNNHILKNINRLIGCSFLNGFVLGLMSLVCLVIMMLGSGDIQQPSSLISTTSRLAQAIEIDNVMRHLKELEAIALQHPNKSRSVENAYKQSAEYVMDLLAKQTDCELSVQPFKVPVWDDSRGSEAQLELSGPSNIRFQTGVDFKVMRYGGSMPSTLENARMLSIENGGCSSDDFSALAKVKNAAVLIESDVALKNCSVWDAAYNAQNAGASAVIFYNSFTRTGLLGHRVRLTQWKEGDPLMSIPVVSVLHSVGQALLNAVGSKSLRLNLKTFAEIRIVETFNVICDTQEGDADNIVMIGAHLDSVPEGPGMVDNASGSSTVLEVFLKMYELGLQKELVNKLRFAWWGAEELGLMGSRHYCRVLQANSTDYDKIAIYSNHDMLGSPNYVPYIYDGQTAPEKIKTSSGKLQSLYEVFFKSLPPLSKFSDNYHLLPMTGGSDFYSFLEIGIPSGGLATGAADIKTMEDRHRFGGLANAAHDPCYHKSCDTVDNVAQDVLEVMAKSVGFVVESLARRENIRIWLNTADFK